MVRFYILFSIFLGYSCYCCCAGSTLLKVGLCQQKLGALERDFAASATQAFSEPLKKFMESDLKVCMLS